MPPFPQVRPVTQSRLSHFLVNLCRRDGRLIADSRRVPCSALPLSDELRSTIGDTGLERIRGE